MLTWWRIVFSLSFHRSVYNLKMTNIIISQPSRWTTNNSFNFNLRSSKMFIYFHFIALINVFIIIRTRRELARCFIEIHNILCGWAVLFRAVEQFTTSHLSCLRANENWLDYHSFLRLGSTRRERRRLSYKYFYSNETSSRQQWCEFDSRRWDVNGQFDLTPCTHSKSISHCAALFRQLHPITLLISELDWPPYIYERRALRIVRA